MHLDHYGAGGAGGGGGGGDEYLSFLLKANDLVQSGRLFIE